MAAKTSWHRYGTKLRHGHPMYKENRVSRTDVRRGEKEGKGVEN